MGQIKYYVRQGKHISTGADIFYAQNIRVQPVDINQICEEVSHSTTVTKADVLAILTELEHQFVNLMRSNKSVHFGLLGCFRTTMQSDAARTRMEFSKGNIRKIGLRFTPSATMKYKLKYGHPDLNFVLTEPNE